MIFIVDVLLIYLRRDMAQGYIDAAYNAQSIDLELAQAAWVSLLSVNAHRGS